MPEWLIIVWLSVLTVLLIVDIYWAWRKANWFRHLRDSLMTRDAIVVANIMALMARHDGMAWTEPQPDTWPPGDPGGYP